MIAGRKPPMPRYLRSGAGSFEVCKGGASRFDFRDPYHLAVSLSWPAFVLAALGSLVFIDLFFALFYVLIPGAIRALPAHDFARAFFFSLETLSTVGYGEMSPATSYGYAVASSEMIVGMAFVALLTGLLFVRFSRARTGILFADRAVVASHNGRKTLMVRLGNGRTNMLTRATASLSILLKEISDEGQVSRRYFDLRLICPHLPAFPLTWTLMHVIDETSPLYRMGPEELRDAWARLFLAVEAQDAKLGRGVEELSDWDHQQITFGMRYVDAVVYDENGRATADLARISQVETCAATLAMGAPKPASP